MVNTALLLNAITRCGKTILDCAAALGVLLAVLLGAAENGMIHRRKHLREKGQHLNLHRPQPPRGVWRPR